MSDNNNINFAHYVEDPDEDDLEIVTVPPSSSEVLSTVFGGTLTPTGSLSYEYAQNPDYEGLIPADFVLYKASDGTVQSSMVLGTFVLMDGRWQDRFGEPTAFDDAVSIDEDNTQTISFCEAKCAVPIQRKFTLRL